MKTGDQEEKQTQKERLQSSLRGRIIIPSGGGEATGHHLCTQQPVYTTWKPSRYPHRVFLTISFPPSRYFLVKSCFNSREFSVLRRHASASSQTHPVMIWPLLPGVSQSGLISSTSKSHPCEVLWSDKPALLWGSLIRGDALIKPTHCEHPQKPCFFVLHVRPPGSLFNQKSCTLRRAADRSEWLMNPMRLIIPNLAD